MEDNFRDNTLVNYFQILQFKKFKFKIDLTIKKQF